MVIHSSVRTDGTLVEVVRRSNGTYFVRKAHGIDLLKGHILDLDVPYGVCGRENIPA